MPHISDDKTDAKMGHRLWRLGQMWATCPTQTVDARYQLFLSEGKGSWGFRDWKNHPAEAVARKPKPARRTTVIRTPAADVIIAASLVFAVLYPAGEVAQHTGMTNQTELSGETLRLSLRKLIPHWGQGDKRRCKDGAKKMAKMG